MTPRALILLGFQVSVFRCQHLAPRFPDTRNLTPKANELRCGCPAGHLFPNAIQEKAQRLKCEFFAFYEKNFQHENTKYSWHFFRVFACPVRPGFLLNRGPFVLSGSIFYGSGSPGLRYYTMILNQRGKHGGISRRAISEKRFVRGMRVENISLDVVPFRPLTNNVYLPIGF
jgi:hypothetical protein